MENPVSLHYAAVTAQLAPALAGRWLRGLPLRRRQAVERLRDPADRAATLAGVALLMRALRDAGRMVGLEELEYPPGGKPRLRAGPDFSIAHAPAAGGGRLVACVLATGMRVGLDLEPRGSARPDQLRLVLDAGEREAVADGRLDATTAWVMKEAVLKAAGRGASFARDVALQGHVAMHDGVLWHLQQVDVGDAHVAWLATDRESEPATRHARHLAVADLLALPA
ncbi:MAG: 4'-phosphopantetheinyl transferase superfamily protein [Steroidobacteraceae bacterium]|nr:4'-phosphopantetheinyl transferase superfamily protein [Steroidobacteraceae bacterium]